MQMTKYNIWTKSDDFILWNKKCLEKNILNKPNGFYEDVIGVVVILQIQVS